MGAFRIGFAVINGGPRSTIDDCFRAKLCHGSLDGALIADVEVMMSKTCHIVTMLLAVMSDVLAELALAPGDQYADIENLAIGDGDRLFMADAR